MQLTISLCWLRWWFGTGPAIRLYLSQWWMSLDLTVDKSTLVQLMAWCCQALSHYLSQCWPTYVSPDGVSWPQWVNYSLVPGKCRKLVGKFMYKVYHKDVPTIFDEFFMHNYHLHDHYTRTANHLHVPFASTNLSKTGIRYQGVIIISPVSEGIGGCYGFMSKPPAARHPPPAARNGVNAITQKPQDGLFSNLVYTLVVIVSWPD